MSNSSSEAQRVFFLLQNSSKGSIKSQTQTAIILLQLPQKKWSTFISIWTVIIKAVCQNLLSYCLIGKHTAACFLKKNKYIPLVEWSKVFNTT